MSYNPDVVQKVSLETGENPKLITEVWHEAMRFINKEIASGNFRTVQLPHLGKFTPNYKFMNGVTLRKMLPEVTLHK